MSKEIEVVVVMGQARSLADMAGMSQLAGAARMRDFGRWKVVL